MPELPEVETVRRGLEELVSGFKVRDIAVLDKRTIRRNSSGETGFVAELMGITLGGFKRRGKFLWLPLSPSRCLVAHLGMSGQILVRKQLGLIDKCERVRFVIEKNQETLEIRFVDQRLFGGLFLDSLVQNARKEFVPNSIKHVATDPLEPHFEAESVAAKIIARKAGIKSLLLNQKVVSGIGNIYADEILWEARIHYLTKGYDLNVEEILRVLGIAQRVLSNAVAHGGTSFDQQYKNVNGSSGNFYHWLNSYGQNGKPCKRCQTLIVREAWSNRSSHFCPRCQIPLGPQ